MAKVLITGSAGLIGRILTEELGTRHHVLGLDVHRSFAAPSRRASLRHRATAVKALAGCDAVVDLVSSPATSSWRRLHRNNLRSNWNVFEAAARTGVRRVIYASSNHVTGMYERDEPFASVLAGRYGELDPHQIDRISTSMPIRPDSAYGVAKAWGEAAGRYHAETSGTSVICLRIGHVNGENRPKFARHHAVLLTHRDLVQLVQCCLDAPPEVGFATFYGVSANTWRIWDIDDAAHAIGYRPVDDAGSWQGERTCT